MNRFMTLNKLFSKYKIPEYQEEEVTPRTVSLAEAGADEESREVLTRIFHLCDGGRIVELGERLEEVGTPGTLLRNGRIEMERNFNASPFLLRGRRGRPGDLEDYYRSEPVVRDAVDSVVEVQVGADRPILPPKDELVPEELQEEMAEWCDQLEGWFANLEDGGLQTYIFEATQSVCLFGFAPFEPVWAIDEEYRRTSGKSGVAWPVKLGYREPSTLDEWVMNDRQDKLLGAIFDTGGETQIRYTLTATGTRLTDYQMVNARLSGRGNNWEGVSPIRPAIHWIRFKRLLGQIAAVAAQKYGVPITLLKVDPALVVKELMSILSIDEDTIDDAIAKFDAAEAVEALVHYLPPPLTAETIAPPGTMPSLEDMIRYCDEMINRPFSNEGSLLGHNHTGSYALSETSENKFLRGAPAYSRVIMAPINELIRLMTIQRFGRKLRAYPRMGMRLSARDSRELLRDLVRAMAGKPLDEWPEALQEEALELFGFTRDLLQREIEEVAIDEGLEPEPLPEQTAEEGVDYSGAQVSAMVDVVQRVTSGQIPRESAIEIMKLAFGITTAEAAAFFSSEQPTSLSECSCGSCQTKPGRTVELSEGLSRSLAEFTASAENLRTFMDAAEDRLAKRLKSIAEEQRRELQSLTADVIAPEELDRIADDLIARYKPRYLEAVRDVSEELQVEGVAQLLRELGLDAPSQMRAPRLPDGLRQQFEANLMQVAKEANSRNVQNMVDQRIEQAPDIAAGRQPRALEALALGTMAAVARKITGRSFNAGRDAVIEAGIEAQERKTGEEYAGARSPSRAQGATTRRGKRSVTCVRSSMLDEDVCDNCDSLDFENGGKEYVVGTAIYYEDMPPLRCLGRKRCRCVYIYDAPEEIIDSVAEYVGAQLVI